jgi:NDP-sugar pyrophosphorylase family protein
LVDTAIVLAVGSVLHQSQLTYNRPRAMLPVLGKPMVVRNMERLFRAGIHRYIVIVGEDEGAVAAYLNSQWLPNVEIQFIIQSLNNSLIRTLTEITHQITQPFLITSYNTFTHINFPEQLLNHYDEGNEDLLLTVAPTSISKSSSNYLVQVNNQKIISINPSFDNRDTNSLIVGSLAICGKNFTDFMTQYYTNTNSFGKQLIDIFQQYIQSGGTAKIAETSWLLQIESDYDLLTLNRLLLDDGPDTHILSELPASVQIIPPVRIDPHVSVGQGAQLGPRVYLESGCSVGHHATISNAIVLQNAVITADSQIDDSIISTRVRVENPDKQ